MSQDLEEYQAIIEQLKPMVNEPEFNQLLEQVAAGIPKPKRFLIKMELKRQAKPCSRRIDLRGHVDGECREFEYDDLTHYLDEIAIEVFERQVRMFGKYTLGVFEAVSNTENNFRVMYRKQREEQLKAQSGDADAMPVIAQAPIIRFNHFPNRCEERMNFAVNLELFTELNRSIQATSVDISLNGLKVKLNKDQLLKPGERITVHYRGLETQFTLDKKMGLTYQVANFDSSRQEQRVGLKRVDEVKHAAFDAFLERFIHGNKRRYKVNMENTLDAIFTKACEQYYTPNLTSVPVYLEPGKESYIARYALLNDANRDTIYYWNNENQENQLGYLFSKSRVEQLLAQSAADRHTTIYCFNHVKDDAVYFYSASLPELNADPALKALFLGFGSRKASWRVYHVQLTTMQPQHSHCPLSIPSNISDAVKKQNQAPAPRLMARLKNLRYIALLTDITDESCTQAYQAFTFDKEKVTHLKVFGHPRNKAPQETQLFRFKYFNQRKETRFQLRSQVIVKTADMELEGVTEDFSHHGMRIELKRFFHEPVESVVQLSFPVLQKVTQKYNLTDLSYQVVEVSADRNVLHLRVLPNQQPPIAEQFFEELIKNNRSRLRAYRDEEELPGIGQALRNLYCRNLINVGIAIEKDGIEYRPSAMISHHSDGRLMNLLNFHADGGHGNFYAFYGNRSPRQNIIGSTLKQLRQNNQPVMQELFIAFAPNRSDIRDAIRTQLNSQFANDKQRKEFISRACANGQFIALKIFLTRTGRPDMEFIQSELNYINMYAVHKAKELEEQLWNITAIGDLIDITQEVMERYQVEAPIIAANEHPPIYTAAKELNIKALLKA